MSTKQHTGSTRSRRRLRRTLAVSATAALVVAPGIAGAGSGGGTAPTTDRDQLVAQAMGLEQTYIRLWNDRKWEELGGLYKEDAIALPPNHEPIQGRAAIIDYYKGLRDALGELEGGTEPFRATASGNLVSIVGKYSVVSGRLRVTGHELWERQPDGSLKFAVDQYGLRDPLR
jgi:ketosteroid isomerase-like protein